MAFGGERIGSGSGLIRRVSMIQRFPFDKFVYFL